MNDSTSYKEYNYIYLMHRNVVLIAHSMSTNRNIMPDATLCNGPLNIARNRTVGTFATLKCNYVCSLFVFCCSVCHILVNI